MSSSTVSVSGSPSTVDASRCATRSVPGITGLGPPLGEHVDEVAADAVEGGDHPGDVLLRAVEAVEEALDPRHEAVGVLGSGGR